MLITITILAILLALALPSMLALIRDQRVKAATYDVYATFIFARSEAIKRNGNVLITPNATDWGGGWQVLTGATSLKAHAAISKISISGPAGTVALHQYRPQRPSQHQGRYQSQPQRWLPIGMPS